MHFNAWSTKCKTVNYDKKDYGIDPRNAGTADDQVSYLEMFETDVIQSGS